MFTYALVPGHPGGGRKWLLFCRIEEEQGEGQDAPQDNEPQVPPFVGNLPLWIPEEKYCFGQYGQDESSKTQDADGTVFVSIKKLGDHAVEEYERHCHPYQTVQ